MQLIKAIKSKKKKQGMILLEGFPHGLNTAIPAFQLAPTEMAACVNWKVNARGQLETRRPVVQYTDTAVGTIKSMAGVPIGSTTYKLFTDSDHKLYYLSGLTPTLIGTLEGATEIIAYNEYAILLDESYIKYLDTDLTIKIAYDDGTGTSGYQFDNSADEDSGSFQLGDGTNTKVAQQFTTQSWDSGYTIPPTTVSAYLTKEGAPTGSINAVIREADLEDLTVLGTAIATKEIVADVSDLTGVATEHSITFVAADITTEMTPETDYYCSLEHTGGDADNCVHVHYNTVTSGGLAYHYDGWWNTDVTENYLMSLRPGRPPKGSSGTIREERLWVIGDPDNPGYAWYGNLSQFDWSSTDGGGYVGVVDDGSNSFPAGGIANLYGDLYIYGQESQPCLCKLTGDSPSDYVLSKIYQRAWTLPKTLQNTVNDLWIANKDGVDTLSGVQEYGDIRTFSYSDSVEDRMTDYWSDDAIAGYYPKDGQYWLYFPGHHRVLVWRTKKPVLNLEQSGPQYPCFEYELCKGLYTSDDYKWTASSSGTNEYYCELAGSGDPSISDNPDYVTLDNKKITEGTIGSLNDHQWAYGDNDTLGYSTLYIRDESGDPDTTGVEIRNVLVPTAFGMLNNEFMFGASDGYVYKIDSDEYKELTTEKIYFDVISPYLLFPMTHVNFDKYQVNLISEGGGSVDISFYKDEFQDAVGHSFTKILVADDRLTIDDLTMDAEDAVFLVDTSSTREINPLWNHINMNARSIQVRINNVTLAGYPLFLNEQTLRYRGLSH